LLCGGHLGRRGRGTRFGDVHRGLERLDVVELVEAARCGSARPCEVRLHAAVLFLARRLLRDLLGERLALVGERSLREKKLPLVYMNDWRSSCRSIAVW
jgi:hypothetical protein